MGKMKRFLLRYDPPGIGLEFEDEEGQVSVKHLNLPEMVDNPKDLFPLVDQLIADEEILSKKRHRSALIQLLGRLYQVEVDPAEEEAVESPKQADDSLGNLQEGQEVVLVGLSGKNRVHNGELGIIVSRAKKDKFEVQRTGEAEPIKVKGAEHLIPCLPKGTSLSVGSHVAIRGLRNHIELNGCLGRVVECHEETHRFEVRATDSGQLFRVKQENLVPIEGNAIAPAKENREPNAINTPRLKKEPTGGSMGGVPETQASTASITAAGDNVEEVFEPGSQVQLVGLKTAMVYNGQTAEVLSVDRARFRYEIRLADGAVKTIRAENVRLAPGHSKTSARTRRNKDSLSGGQGSGKMR